MQRGDDPAESRRLVAQALPSVIGNALGTDELEAIRARLVAQPLPAGPARFRRDDWLGGLGVLLLVFLSTLPVSVPFLVMHEALPALRASNAVAIGLLYVAGHMYGRHTGRSPAWTGLAMVVLGALLVGLTIALGG